MTRAAGLSHLCVYLAVVLAFFGASATLLLALVLGFWLLGPAYLLTERIARLLQGPR